MTIEELDTQSGEYGAGQSKAGVCLDKDQLPSRRERLESPSTKSEEVPSPSCPGSGCGDGLTLPEPYHPTSTSFHMENE